jgi:hypothetical protein
MSAGSITLAINLPGLSINLAHAASGTGMILREKTIPKGQAGTLDTRTDDNTGVVGLSAGHGIVTGNKVDVSWSGGVRRGMDATVSGNNVTVDGGAGDVLPAQTTAVVVSKCVDIDTDFLGNLLKILTASADQNTFLDFQDAGGVALITGGWSLATGVPQYWYDGSGVTNPLAGDAVANIRASNSETDADATLKIGVFYD